MQSQLLHQVNTSDKHIPPAAMLHQPAITLVKNKNEQSKMASSQNHTHSLLKIFKVEIGMTEGRFAEKSPENKE